MTQTLIKPDLQHVIIKKRFLQRVRRFGGSGSVNRTFFLKGSEVRGFGFLTVRSFTNRYQISFSAGNWITWENWTECPGPTQYTNTVNQTRFRNCSIPQLGGEENCGSPGTIESEYNSCPGR